MRNLWSHGEAEAKGRELINIALSHKPKEAPRVWMDRDLQVGFRKVDGGHPVALTNREKDRLDGLHAEVRHLHVEIEGREIDDGSPRPRGLPHNEKSSVKAWGRKRARVASPRATLLVDRG